MRKTDWGIKMAAKKYYAVKKGKKTGIFSTWEECRASVEGCPGAEYKGFAELAEAESYLGLAASGVVSRKVLENAVSTGKRQGVETDAAFEGKRQGVEMEADSEGKHQGLESDSAFEGKRKGVEDETVSQDRLQGVAADTAPMGGTKGKGEDNSFRGWLRREKEEWESLPGEAPEAGTLLAYVDGSYDDSLKKYAFGCVFILPDGRIYTEYGNGDNEQSLRHRNVTGEMLGAMYAVKTAMLSGFSQIEIRYDYEGIEKWVTGAWRSRTELTGKYATSMREWGKSIKIRFTKVAAHTNVYYNELADKMAKTGLREGKGVPKLCSLTEEGHERDI